MGVICNALLGSDINVKYVMKLRENVMNKFKNQEAEGANLRNLIKAEVIRELTSLLEA
jgi:signal recognition particle GTPase